MAVELYYNIASEQTYRDGDVIFEEGSSGDWVYVVVSGMVEVSKTVNRRKYLLGLVEPGEIFGELAMIGAVKRTATTRAIGETTVGIIDRDFLGTEFNKLSSEFRAMLVAFVARFIKMMERIQGFSTRKEERIAKKLSLAFKDRKTFVKAYSGNISNGGLFIRHANPLGIGEQFLLKLQLPGIKEPIPIKCQVAWVRKPSEATAARPPGMGVKFIEMNDKDKVILKKYVNDASKGIR
jgi:uncharacterized protein (TIGR02266 family)